MSIYITLEKNMHKLETISLVVALGLAACGSSQKSPEEPDVETDSNESLQDTAEDTTETAEDVAEDLADETEGEASEKYEEAAEGADEAEEAVE